MEKLQIFECTEFGEIRTIEENGKILFCGSDVAKALGYVDTPKAIKTHCKEDGWAIYPVIDSLGREQQAKFITEGNVYRLVAHSKLPNAEKFESWIFDEVLPSIRKHGAYMTPEKLEEIILNPDMMIKLCNALKDEQDKNKALQAVNSKLTVDNQIMRPKADYFDELVDRNLLTNFRDTAKLLEVKEKNFINFLIEKKYIYKDKKGKLMPYADKNNGLFEVKECFNEKTNWRGTQTLITPKGRETFRLLFLKAS